MRKRLIEKFTKCKEGSLGYTLTELLVVIGIIAIVCAIAIPSVVSISKSLRFAQRNDYAKSIFMAAQANLTEMRADGGLAPLQRAGLDSLPVQEELCGFPVEDWSPEYVYTSSETSQQLTYALVLPVGSVDSALREQQVIIEYNPLTGNVYSVFYSEEKDQNILQDYRDGKLPRNGEGDEKLRKEMMLGYYDGSGLSSAELEIERTEARITFENGEEGIVTVHIPMPDLYVGHHEEFMKGLEVKLDITGELNGGEIKDIMVKRPGQVGTNCKLAVDGKTVEVTYVLDSLAKRMSFANLSAGTRLDPDTTQTQSTVNTSLTAIMDEGRFPIKPGENVTLSAEVTFQAANDRPNVAVQNAKLGGVNPMFGYLTENLTGGGYTLTIENGRNLQNLNAIAPSVASQITAVVFTQDIYWNQTVAYYNQKYGTPAEPFKSPADEAPARALPYFVPIYNDALFGSAKFNYDERTTNLGLISFKTKEKVPTLSDAEDTNVNNHAKISGKLENGNPVRIFNLNIDATKYTVPNNTLPSNPTDDQKAKQGHYYVSIHNIDHPVNYEFTGLFAYINTTIDNVHVVNPVVKGSPFVDGEKYVLKWRIISFEWVKEVVYSSPATGALVGASGYNSLITNCAAYVDTSAAASFDRSKLTQGDYNKDADQNWYGVSGEGAVGGLVGYAKSHRTTTGALTGNTQYLAFSNCFAAVNVSGNMRGQYDNGYVESGWLLKSWDYEKHFGYTNGVGGLVGNSQLTNFYNCYASGNVRANGCYVVQTSLDKLAGGFIETIQKLIGQEVIDLLYCGRRSMGVGGFVGTSHGTRYTNCFSTGNVDGQVSKNSSYALGSAGFVGIMSYEETLAFGNDEGQNVNIAQRTVFENCYAAGISRTVYTENGQSKTKLAENFSGANARVKLDLKTSGTYVMGSYYRALAPYYDGKLWGVGEKRNLPSYSNYYIFKDSYYLVHYPDLSQDNTNRCATAESYENLMSMHWKHQDATWVNTQIDNIKKIWVYTDPGRYLFSSYDDTPYYYKEVYFDKYPEKGSPEDADYEKSLEQIYREKYEEGFLPAGALGGRWTNINAASTHPYSLARDKQAYPFSIINGLEYYGDWPYEPQYANIAYYEDYQDQNGNKSSTGFYFDSEDTSTLQQNGTVLSDGYAIISANSDDTITISINGGKAETLTCIGQETYKPNGISAVEVYYVYRIPSSLYEGLSADSGYYVTAKVTVNGTTYTMYFNPTTAISHVIGATTKPETPDEIYIRTARQLNALSEARMQGVWASENTTIIQQLNIDAAEYDWNGAAEGLGEIPTLSTIGVVKVKDAEGKETETIVPFNATYTGTGGYVAQAQIKGFTFAAPLFANVGDKGAVRSLAIEVVGGENGITIGKTTDDYTALVAAVCSGELENVDLTLTGSVTLNAKTAAGLLAGYITGTEADRAAVIGCDIQADSLTVNAVNDGTVNAGNAGAVIGQAEFCDIRQGVDSENLADDLTLTLNNTLTLNGTDVGAYLGASGDLNGDKTIGEVNVDGLTITLKGITAEAQRLGALAGTLDTGSIKNLRVTLDNAYSVTHNTEKTVIAGVAAVAKNALVQSVTVNVNGSLTGDTAAGVFGTAENLTVQTTEVNVNSTITGTQAAAGMAVSIEGGEFSSGTTVRLKGTIRAESTEEVTTEDTTAEDGSVIEGTTTTEPAGRAAGFAVEVHGQVSAGLVIAETAGTITGNAEAAGFACEISAQVTGTRVAGKLNITANGKKVTTAEDGSTTEEAVGRAAGFAVKIAGNNLAINTNGVTPALENTAEGYKKAGSNNNLTVHGGNAAMFAVEIGSGVNVRNCYVLGRLTGADISGFAVTNGGAIDGCSANVTLSGGNAFVRENTGAISTSYGWYGDGSAENGTTTAAIETGSVVSSYFVDIDVPVTEDCKSAYIYYNAAYKGDNPEQTTPLELMDDTTLANLNGEGGRNWLSGDSYGEYPYVTHIPAGYPYPQIRPHYGNWATPPRYAYGVLYFEKYEDENKNVSWKLQIEELSLDGEATQTQNLNSNDSFDETGNIVQAGYALFFKGDTLENLMTVDKKALAGTIEIPSTELSNISGYSFVKLAENATITITRNQVENETTTSVTVNTRYAHEFGTNVTEHIIRTETQLAKVGAEGTYSQTHDIALSSSFATIENFKGIYNGDGFQIQKSGTVNQWMKAIDSEGKVLNVDLNLGSLNDSFFGNVQGEVTLADAYFAAVGENGKLISTLSGTMTCAKPIVVHGNLDGAIIGTVANNKQNDWAVEIRDADTASVITEKGAVIGTVNSGATVNLTLTYGKGKDISGSIVDTVNGSFTLNNNPNFGTVSGQLFDTVSGNVTLIEGVTVGTLSGMVCGNVTNTITANKLVNVTTVNELAMTTAENGTATVTGGAVFGNVSGTVTLAGGIRVDTLSGSLVGATTGTVTTNAVSIGTLNGSLVYALNGGTVTTGTVTVTTLNESLVYDFAGGILSGTGVTVTNGIAVPVFTDELSVGAQINAFVVKGNVTLGGEAQGALVNTNNGTLSGLTLRAPSISATAADNTVGGLVGTNGTNGDITNCVVEGSAANTTATVTITGAEGKALTFGGLVGVNSGDIAQVVTDAENETTITGGCTVNVDINVTAQTGTIMDIGGLVGVNAGTIGLNTQSMVNITYTQSTDDEATIGGLVAVMNGGSITGLGNISVPDVTGNINLDGTGADRDYIIGGAVGEDNGATYRKISSTVAVSTAWAGSNSVATSATYAWEQENFGKTAVNPSGAGPVGKFVGFVSNSGSFTDCTAIDYAVSGTYNLQFLGEIEPGTPGKLTGTAYGFTSIPENLTYTSKMNTDDTKKEYAPGVNKTVDEWITIPSEQKYSADQQYRVFTTILTNCYFDYPGMKNLQSQTTDLANLYFLEAGAQETVTNYTDGDAVKISFNSSESKVVSSFRSYAEYDGGYAKTDYYYEVSGKYYMVYVKYGYWDYAIRASLAIDQDHNGEPEKEIESAYRGISDWRSDDSVKVYKANNISPADQVKYLLIDSTRASAIVWNGTDGISTETFVTGQSFDSTSNLYKGIWTYNSSNTSLMNLVCSKYLTANNGFGISDGAASLSISAVVPNGATANSDALFKFGNVNANYYLYAVTEGTHWYKVTLENNGLYNAYCGYEDSGIVRPEPTASIESDLPADSGEATQGTEVPEATGSNETATVPPAAEDGNNN